MKNNFIFLIILSILFGKLSSQEFTYINKLKKELNENDRKYLIKESRYLTGSKPQFTFNFSSVDVEKRKEDSKSDSPSSIDKIKNIKKDLKNDYTDARKNFAIANIYRRLNNREKFMEHIEKSFNQAKQGMEKEPEEEDYYLLIGQIFQAVGDYKQAVSVLDQLILKFPEHEAARGMLILLKYNLGDIMGSKRLCKESILKFPEKSVFYIFNAMITIFETMSTGDQKVLENKALNLPMDSIFDFTEIKNASKKYPSNFALKLTEQLVKQNHFTYKMILKMPESSKKLKDLKFSEADIEEIRELEAFYKKEIKHTDAPNRYIFYYALGSLAIIKAETKQAVKYLEKALKDRKNYISTFSENPNNIYDNIIAAYIQADDTVNAIKVLKQKNDDKPLIDENAEDYNLTGTFMLMQNKLSEADKYFNNALKISSGSVNALCGKASVSINKYNYQDAKDYLTGALEINKQNINIHILFGINELSNNSVEEAYNNFKQAYLINPEDVTINNLLEEFFINEDE